MNDMSTGQTISLQSDVVCIGASGYFARRPEARANVSLPGDKAEKAKYAKSGRWNADLSPLKLVKPYVAAAK